MLYDGYAEPSISARNRAAKTRPLSVMAAAPGTLPALARLSQICSTTTVDRIYSSSW